MESELRVEIGSDGDVLTARAEGRAFASQLGFSSTDLTLIATAISEIARNIVLYARRGEMTFRLVEEDDRQGMLVVARDEGPGIEDVALAMRDDYSTGQGLGLGLPGARRLMDEFEIASSRGKGTTVTMRKWATARG